MGERRGRAETTTGRQRPAAPSPAVTPAAVPADAAAADREVRP